MIQRYAWNDIYIFILCKESALKSFDNDVFVE